MRRRKLAAIEAITRTKPGLSDEAISVLLGIVSDEKQSPELRANALAGNSAFERLGT